MGKQVVSKGKTIQEAVILALDLLNAQKEEADIEIVEREQKGFLGLGSKPAVVRVTIRDHEARGIAVNPVSSYEAIVEAAASLDATEVPAEASPFGAKDESAEETDREGKIWVQDQRIYCKDAPGKYPLLAPGNKAVLYKNHERVVKTIVASEQDVFTVKLQDETHDPHWEISMGKDNLEATIKVRPGRQILRKLKDLAPESFIELEVEEQIKYQTIEHGLVMDKLKEIGIVHGIDIAEIAKACASKEEGTFIIAKATPPVQGKNGYFQPFQEVEIKRGLKERPDGTIDYREIQEFPSVERGQVLGVLHPPTTGKPGISVANEPIFPAVVYPFIVREGKGVSLVEDGTKVVATSSGHPEVKTKGQLACISVVPKLVLNQDIDIQTGNIHYAGDVDIHGSVQDKMIVEAKGNLFIRDNVNQAKVSAGSSLIIQNNVVSSEVTAGESNLLTAELALGMKELIKQMKQMVGAMEQLAKVSAFKVSSFTQTGLGPLIKILCDGRFKSFLAVNSDIIKKINKGMELLDEEWLGFSERLQKGFIQTLASGLRTEADFHNLIRLAESLALTLENTGDESFCFMKAVFVHNSRLYCGGDISIERGIYNSSLHARGRIEVGGVVLGGEIYATDGISVLEAGAKSGAYTKLSVSPEGTIRMGKVLEDTVIQVGTKSHKFTKQTSQVFARLNTEGELLIS